MFPASINPAAIEAMMPNGPQAGGSPAQNGAPAVCPLCGSPLPMPYNSAGAPQGMPDMPPMPPMPPMMPGGMPGAGNESELLEMLMGGAGRSSGARGAAQIAPPAGIY